MLRSSNILEEIRGKVDRNEPIDWDKYYALQALDLAIIGEEFVAERIQAERDADDLAVMAAKPAVEGSTAP